VNAVSGCPATESKTSPPLVRRPAKERGKAVSESDSSRGRSGWKETDSIVPVTRGRLGDDDAWTVKLVDTEKESRLGDVSERSSIVVFSSEM